ncbi:GerMN domain-containing protein [Thermodesulfovibrio sp. 3907-1M]|uniref:GerMN domain-containing protein n=1 Tax=Thermodesulfovibrio autotrophicus TaxID=3118333 RepID=A0AAU8GW12_9BACT
MNKRLITISVLILVAIATTVIYFTLFKHDGKTSEKSQTEQTMVNFKIYLPSSNSTVVKEIYLQKESSELKNIERILESFLSELPLKETKILGIYRDMENVVYIDLSKDFAIPQSMLQEYLMLKSLYKTLKENFPWIKDIKILIESKEVETVSGHISIASSLKEAVEEN